MSKDLTPIIEGWEHDPNTLQVRIIRGSDGRERLQTRVDLGVLQMELSGRPDGKRPSGCESWLDHHEQLSRTALKDGADYSLDSEACAELMREGVQYYHRYLALFHLGRYDLVARDAERNLRLFAFVKRHAANPRDALQFDQYRPYVTMMRARALGLHAVERGENKAAIAKIDEGIRGIRAFLAEYSQSDREEQCGELMFLLRWRDEVAALKPLGPIERLQEQLELAVARENFEDAARLRDQIKRLRESLPENAQGQHL